MPHFHYKHLHQNNLARLGEVHTAHGVIRTPAFMPVGTAGTVKAMYMDQVRASGADIILGNTYHLMLRPTAERVAKLGGLHKFSGWNGPILTDSGGFQVMSLSKLSKVTEEGVRFASHIDGAKHMLTPERAMEIQALLGSDIHMQLDECISLPAPEKEMRRAMELSLRWAERSLKAFEAIEGRGAFAIVQGGDHAILRRQSAENLVQMPFHGYAIGGLAVGEGQETMFRVLEDTLPFLPENKPRYLMGVGTPEDLIGAVKRGVDMFDCVMPTRAGRHGLAYTREGKFNMRNAKFAEDMRPLDETSDCPAARDYSRAYIHHLVKSNEPLGGMLLSWNNIWFYQNLMQRLRDAINEGKVDEVLAYDAT